MLGKIKSVKLSTTLSERTSVLKEAPVKKKLREFHDAFVFCPCKRLYASIIAKELKFPNGSYPNANKTYDQVNEDQVSIVNRHKNFQNGIGLDLEEDFRKLPPMH